jgi:deoxyribonuclease-4
MLIGAHVSPAGGLEKAIGRGEEKGCEAIQIFNQSPRMWRPTAYGEDDFAAFRAAMKPSPVKAVLIHAVYLVNCASEDAEIRDKSRASLIQSLRVGAGIGAVGVVLHPGSAKQGDVTQAIKRAGKVIKEALTETDRCSLHLEDTAGAGGTLGRSFEELAELLSAAGGGSRLGVCLDSCHLLASGYDIRTAAGLTETMTRSTASSVSSGCARCTSTTPRPSWAPTAIATPTSAPASWAIAAAPPTCPSRASRRCRW